MYITILFYRNSCIISSTRLLRLFFIVLMKTPDSPLINHLITFLFTSNSLLLNTLINRLNDINNTVAIVTMQLFNTLLQIQHPLVMKCLFPYVESTEKIEGSSYFELFMNNFQECLPHINTILKNDHHGNIGNIMKDIEYEMTAIQEVRKHLVIDENNQDNPNIILKDPQHELLSTSFISILLSRLSMFLRQSMEVNLEVSQIITTISMIVDPALFTTLFLTKNSISFVQLLNKV